MGGSTVARTRGLRRWAQAAGAVTAVLLIAASPPVGAAVRAEAPAIDGAPGSTSAAAPRADTVAHQGDPAHRGHLEGVGLAPPLTEVWRVDLGGDVAAPVVADGRIFTVATNLWGEGATLHALDLGTGARLWGPVDLGSRDDDTDVTGVAYDGGRLFVVDAARFVRAYDAATGRRLWQTQHEALWHFTAAPVAADGDVAVLTRGALSVLDQRTGATRWRTDTEVWEGSLALTGETLVASQGCRAVWALDRATGEVRWRRGPDVAGNGQEGGAAVVDGRVHAVCRAFGRFPGGDVLTLDDGERLGVAAGDTAPAVTGTTRYVVRGGALVAEDVRSGALRWTRAPETPLALPPLVVDGVVYSVDEAGGLHGFAADDGQVVAQVATGGVQLRATSSTAFPRGLAAADGHLVVPDRRGLVAYRGAGVAAPDRAPAVIDAPPHTPGTPGAPQATSYQGDASHRGVASAGLRPDDLRLAWTKDLGGVVSHPIIADGRVIVTAEDGGSRLLWAFDRADGTVLWGPLRVGQGIGGPAFLASDDATVFVLEGEGRLRALDAATGIARWVVDVPDGVVDGNEGRLFRTPPIAAHGRVYALGIGLGGVLTALDQRTGEVAWQTAVPDGGGLAADDERVYVGAQCSRRALDPDDGAGLWEQTYRCAAGGDEFAAPAIADGRVYGRDGSILGNSVLEAGTGEHVGTFATSQPFAIDGSRGFFLVDGALRAVDLATGFIAWERRPDTPLVTPPLVVDGTVYVGDDQGLLVGMSPATGEVVWSDRAGERFRPAVVHGVRTMTTLGAAEGVLAAPAWHRLTVFATPDAGVPEEPEPPEPPAPRRVRDRVAAPADPGVRERRPPRERVVPPAVGAPVEGRDRDAAAARRRGWPLDG